MQRPSERGAQHLVFFDAGWRRAAHHFLAKEDGTKGGRKVHFWAEKKEREEISIGLLPFFRRPNRGRCFFPPGGIEAESDKDVVVVVA